MSKYAELGLVEIAHRLLLTWQITEDGARRFEIDLPKERAQPATTDSPRVPEVTPASTELLDYDDGYKTKPAAEDQSAAGYLMHWSVPRVEP